MRSFLKGSSEVPVTVIRDRFDWEKLCSASTPRDPADIIRSYPISGDIWRCYICATRCHNFTGEPISKHGEARYNATQITVLS